MTDRLRVFVASSSERIAAAERVADVLRIAGQDGPTSPLLDVKVWDKGVFNFSASYIESLEQELDRADFAVVIQTADDAGNVRNKAVNLPRDNVIFELGLFIGRLGRRRCFFFVDGDSTTKLVSDLSGVKSVEFYDKSPNPEVGRYSLRAQARSVRKQMLGQNLRYKPSVKIRSSQHELWRFCQRLSGSWWERMRRGDDDMSALSYVLISTDEVTNTPRLDGRSFDTDGGYLAEWRSVVSGVELGSNNPTVSYRWEGEFDDRIGQPYGGGGRIKFDNMDLRHASGYFYDTNYALLQTDSNICLKHFGLYRCEPHEIEIMRRAWSAEAKSLVCQKLASLQGY
jgi:hypothetical protein